MMSDNLYSDDTTKKKPTALGAISKNQNVSIIKKFYIESYGCQMNFSDSEIVASIMQQHGFELTTNYREADLILINTCAIRDRAEQTIRKRLTEFNKIKKKQSQLMVGVLGCMAERLKKQLLEEEKVIDLVAGPDAYRDLPHLVQEVERGHKAVNTFLSREETYADINPIRLDSNGVTAFISIMRGCNNMCSFCIVPFTRGRERSRSPHSIIQEAADLFEQGYREVTLLGQNVDSYLWNPNMSNTNTNKQKEVTHQERTTVNFAHLLEQIASLDPRLRVRFSTSHPKDITDDVLYTIQKYDNICKHIHLPVQSGNSRILQRMNRTYNRAWYIQKIETIWNILGKTCGLSSDMIAGFCSETEAEHQDTLSLMDYVQYDFSYIFYYSQRPGTLAARKYPDDIPLEVKKRRLNEIIEKQREHSLLRNQEDIGKVHHVLVEGNSKKSGDFLQGRNSANKVIIFPKGTAQPGDYVYVKVQKCNSATLFGTLCS